MYVWPQSGRALSLGILPSINVRMPRAIIPARLAARRLMDLRRNRYRRGGGLTGLGAVPFPINGGRFPVCPQIVQWIPPGCTSKIIYDSNRCAQRVPVCSGNPPAGATPAAATPASGPVPAGFPTNQIFVATDGSQWMYSASQGTWINVGTPYNVNAPNATAPSTTTTATAPSGAPAAVPVVVSPPATDTYGSVISFLTQSSLIPSVPNWIIGLGAVLLVKKVSSSGSQKNPRRRRRQ